MSGCWEGGKGMQPQQPLGYAIVVHLLLLFIFAQPSFLLGCIMPCQSGRDAHRASTEKVREVVARTSSRKYHQTCCIKTFAIVLVHLDHMLLQIHTFAFCKLCTHIQQLHHALFRFTLYKRLAERLQSASVRKNTHPFAAYTPCSRRCWAKISRPRQEPHCHDGVVTDVELLLPVNHQTQELTLGALYHVRHATGCPWNENLVFIDNGARKNEQVVELCVFQLRCLLKLPLFHTPLQLVNPYAAGTPCCWETSHKDFAWGGSPAALCCRTVSAARLHMAKILVGLQSPCRVVKHHPSHRLALRFRGHLYTIQTGQTKNKKPKKKHAKALQNVG